ncbi:MAG TPA: hypothetical protein VFX41_07850 [Actinomycetales bacterium]|nr:hypothetical protein [Actinomycetales bacterium]
MADLLTKAELAKWARKDPAEVEADPFAELVVFGVSALIRDAGDSNWTPENIPERAKLIACLKAKHFYNNPDVLTQESTGPIQESRGTAIAGRDLGAVHNMTLSEEEESILARLAGKEDPHEQRSGGGLWIQPTLADIPSRTPTDIYVTDQSGSDWMIPFAAGDDLLYKEA